MARYIGPKQRSPRRFGELITGNGKWLTKTATLRVSMAPTKSAKP